MTKAYLDTNVILRYFINDIPSQAEQIEKRLDQVRDKKLKLYLSPVIVVEVLFHLVKWYKASRLESAAVLVRFIEESGVITENKTQVLESLIAFSREKIDFVDIYLASLAKSEKKKVLSFDRDFDKLDKNIRLKP